MPDRTSALGEFTVNPGLGGRDLGQSHLRGSVLQPEREEVKKQTWTCKQPKSHRKELEPRLESLKKGHFHCCEALSGSRGPGDSCGVCPVTETPSPTTRLPPAPQDLLFHPCHMS